MRRDNYLEQIIDNAKKYQSQLLDKSIMFVYRNDTSVIDYIEVKFKKNNFKHLTGIESRLKPAEFFDNCLNRSLGIDSYRATSNTPLKLSVFGTLLQLPIISATIGEFNGTNPNLQFDIAVAKHQMVLGLIKDRSNFYFPITLLKDGDHFNYMKSQHPILLTFTRDGNAETNGYTPTYINYKYEPDKVFSELSNQIQRLCKFS
jgi:hypothetical protein